MIRTWASLSIWSEALRSDQVSAILNFASDETTLKGSERDPPRGTPSAHGWHVICERKGLDASADEVMNELATRIRPLLLKMPDLRARDTNLEVKIVVRFGPQDRNMPLPQDQDFRIFVEKSVVELIAAFGATFDYAVYRF